MSIPLTINGVTFQYPQQFDVNWGPTLTNWSTAVTNGMLQKAGGSFPLTAEVDFGGSFGIKTLYLKSEESNIATSGILRLSNASTGVVWRNAANNANLVLTVNASNQLTFNGTSIGATTSLTNGHILVGDVSNQPADVAMSGDIAITNAGVTSISSGVIVNADINASAAIALTKLAPTTAYYWYVANTSGVLTPQAVTASRIVTTDANGLPTTVSSPTLTELGYVGGVTSAIQTQIDSKVAKSGDTMAGTLNMGSNKIISLQNGSSVGDAVAFGQLISNNITGTTAGDNAPVGKIGEYVESYVTNVNAGSTGSWKDITSISLDAGDWDIALLGELFINGATISNTAPGIWITTTSSGGGSDGLEGKNLVFSIAPLAGQQKLGMAIPRFRVSITSTTVYYFDAIVNYTVGTPTWQGTINARRMR